MTYKDTEMKKKVYATCAIKYRPRKNSFNLKERAVLSELFRRLCFFHGGDVNERLMLLARPAEVKCIKSYGLITTDSVETLRGNSWYSLTNKGKVYFAPLVRPMEEIENINIFNGSTILNFPYIAD